MVQMSIHNMFRDLGRFGSIPDESIISALFYVFLEKTKNETFYESETCRKYRDIVELIELCLSKNNCYNYDKEILCSSSKKMQDRY